MAVSGRNTKLGQALVKAGVIDEMQMRAALGNTEQWGFRLGKTLVRMRFVHEEQVAKAIADATGFPFIDLTSNPPEPSARPYLDEAFCAERGVFPLAVREKAGSRTLFLAMADPTDVEAIDLTAARGRCRVKPFVACEQLVEKAIDKFYRGANVELQVVDETTIAEMDEMKLVDVNDITMAGVQAPVVHLSGSKPVQAPKGPSPAERMAQRFGPPGGNATAPGLAAIDPLAAITGHPVAAPAPAVTALEARLAALEQQVSALHKTQDASSALLRAFTELLIEKRYLAAEEVRARMGRRA